MQGQDTNRIGLLRVPLACRWFLSWPHRESSMPKRLYSELLLQTQVTLDQDLPIWSQFTLITLLKAHLQIQSHSELLVVRVFSIGILDDTVWLIKWPSCSPLPQIHFLLAYKCTHYQVAPDILTLSVSSTLNPNSHPNIVQLRCWCDWRNVSSWGRVPLQLWPYETRQRVNLLPKCSGRTDTHSGRNQKETVMISSRSEA